MKYFYGFILALASWPILSWAIMLFVGVLHAQLSPAIPAIGYGAALQINLALKLINGLRGAFKGAAKELAK